MRRPSFQFYPADWRNNANLRRCSPAARGVWVDVMCVLHDSDDYGIVRWPLIDLANSANAPIKLVRELVEKSVLKGHDKRLESAYIYVPRSGRKDGEPVTLVAIQDGPVWYSSRMVKDEYVRTIRGESTRFGEAPKDAPKPPFGDGTTSSSSSSPTGKKEPKGSVGKTDLPQCDAKAIVDLYHEVLPELPAVRLMTESRKKAIAKQWRFVLTSKKSDGTRRAFDADQAMTWLRDYFSRARDNDFLMGRTGRQGEHANWQCDLDFLLTEKGMKHVIEKTKETA